MLKKFIEENQENFCFIDWLAFSTTAFKRGMNLQISRQISDLSVSHPFQSCFTRAISYPSLRKGMFNRSSYTFSLTFFSKMVTMGVRIGTRWRPFLSADVATFEPLRKSWTKIDMCEVAPSWINIKSSCLTHL